MIPNIGKISFELYDDFIKQICLGNIKCGSLFSNNFSNGELSNRISNGRNSSGILPSRDNMKKLFIGYLDKNIYSDGLVHSANVHIGDYYFNRSDILKEKDNPYIFRFSSLYKDELQIELLSFDKEGNFLNSDIYDDYLTSLDGITYKVVKQIHNEIEDIDNIHRRGK